MQDEKSKASKGEHHGLPPGEVVAGGHLGEHPASAGEPRRPVLGEGLGGTSGVVRFEIDGVTKSLSKPVIGMELYRVAGSPKSVSVGGKQVKNDGEPVEIEDGAKVTVER